jgi:two-component system NarL family response regulator
MSNDRTRRVMKILLVDDNAYFLKAAKRFLSDIEAVDRVVTATSAMEALESVTHETPDLVLLDLNMPGMGGFEAIHCMRALEPDLKIIVVSLHDSPELRAESERAGAAGYVPKKEFGVQIGGWLAETGGARGGGAEGLAHREHDRQ